MPVSRAGKITHAARRGSRGRSGGGEWIITFADLMTLLFCFFVLLTTLSAAPKDCSGLAEYFERNREQYQNFVLRRSKLECVISLPSDFLFPSAQAQIQPQALQRLEPLFEEIQTLPEHRGDLIIVEGHTDDVPISTERFPSNWELSSARSTNVAAFLRQFGISEDRLSVRAYADNRPREPVVDESGQPLTGEALREARRSNRRVDIVLVDRPSSLGDFSVLFQ